MVCERIGSSISSSVKPAFLQTQYVPGTVLGISWIESIKIRSLVFKELTICENLAPQSLHPCRRAQEGDAKASGCVWGRRPFPDLNGRPQSAQPCHQSPGTWLKHFTQLFVPGTSWEPPLTHNPPARSPRELWDVCLYSRHFTSLERQTCHLACILVERMGHGLILDSILSRIQSNILDQCVLKPAALQNHLGNFLNLQCPPPLNLNFWGVRPEISGF